MDLIELANAIKTKPRGQSILIYGDPKVGKTWLAATLSKLSWIRKLHVFDLENGSDTLITMLKKGILSPADALKFKLYKIPDTPMVPRAMETMMRVLTEKKPFLICELHGKVDCQVCKTGVSFNLNDLDERDIIVIDSGSQLADSIMNYYCRGKPLDFKPGWDEYGAQVRVLSDFMSIIQQASTNYVVLTHQLVVEEKINDEPVKHYYPLMGTENFSRKVAKYFNHVVYCNLGAKVHSAGSSSTYKLRTITGSRLGLRLEDSKDSPNFATAFLKLQAEMDGTIEVLQTTLDNSTQQPQT